MKFQRSIALLLSNLLLFLGATLTFAKEPWPDPIANDVTPALTVGITHGPVLGKPLSDSMSVWVRTLEAGEFTVVYDTQLPLDEKSSTIVGKTTAEKDNTGFVEIKKLSPATRYYYGIKINGVLADTRIDFTDAWPSFVTLPDSTIQKDKTNNPDGLFNIKFSVGSCASQDPINSGGHYGSPPALDTLHKQYGDDVMFHIMNGDTTYEENRDGTLAGLRNNYKLYWSRGRSFSRMMRNIPTVFFWNDHEMSGNLDGCGEIGLKNGGWLMRDVGLKAWYEYAGWGAYPAKYRSDIRFGTANFEKGTDILYDPNADFTSLSPEKVSTIHIGPYTKPSKGTPAAEKRTAPKNGGVYGLVKVVDKNRLQITPKLRATESAKYSIGTHHFHDWKVGNCHFISLDTRGERTRYREKQMDSPKQFILGKAQREWFLKTASESTSDFIFVISPDPFVIYHTSYHVRPEKGATPKGDGFASYLHEREILIKELDKIDKPIMLFTGDVHNSISAQITDNVWEFLCGPMNSTAHPIGTAGKMDYGGWWKSQGRNVKIKWVAGFPDNVHYSRLRNSFFTVVQVNNVAKSAKPEGSGYQWTAYKMPQVVIRFHDGYTGKLMYSESISPLDLVKQKFGTE